MPTIITATASRHGTRDHNCDAASVYVGPDGTTVGAVIDGTGNTAELADLSAVLATIATRVAARRGGLAALLAAADLIHDTYDAAAALATVHIDGDVSMWWIGDCRGYVWDGTTLRQHTTDHTMGQLLRISGGQAAQAIAPTQDHWLLLGLAEATPATVAEVPALDLAGQTLTPGSLILLTTDGLHDQASHDTMTALVRAHAADPHTLAATLVAAATPSIDGYRDDATAVVLAATP